jgi:hypothetical protein
MDGLNVPFEEAMKILSHPENKGDKNKKTSN